MPQQPHQQTTKSIIKVSTNGLDCQPVQF